MLLLTILSWCCLFCIANCQSSSSVYGFCSQVYNMNQFCMTQISGTVDHTHNIPGVVQEPRVGKAGPRGEKGSRGEPGIVNYEEIERKITRKFEATERRLDAKLERLEQLIEKEKVISAEKYGGLKNITDEIQEDILLLQYTNCQDVNKQKAKMWDGRGGIFDIYPNMKNTEVYCDLETDGGGWIVIQRRLDGSENFYRTWEEYASGFGNKSREFWLGLETIHQITKTGSHELRIDLSDWNGNTVYAKYSNFKISGRSDNYRLTVSGYSGNASDSLSYHNKMPFSAHDKDLDSLSSSCAQYLKGGWWFNYCFYSHLNGEYLRTTHSTVAGKAGIIWYHWKSNEALKTSTMMIRKLV